MNALFLIFAIFCIQSNSTVAQSKYNSNNKIQYKKGRYHFKKAWINAGGIHIHPLSPILFVDNFFIGIGHKLPVQYDYTGYYLIKPNLGLGVSLSNTKYTTSELGYEYFTFYSFADYAAYAKLYLGKRPRRPFIDAKFGYGRSKKKSIGFSCYGCEEQGALYLRYSSGPMIQPGMGIDFASSKFIKCGIKLSYSVHYTNRQRDRHKKGWETTSDGIIKRDSSSRPLSNLFFGFYLYI